MSARGLVVFDLDGTLLRGSTVCEILADALGRAEQMREFEKLSTESDITLARVEMARWYEEVPRPELLSYLSSAHFAPGAKEGIASLRQAGIQVGIASITWRFAVEWFAGLLGVTEVMATGLSPKSEIEHAWPHHKASWLDEMAAKHGVPYARTAAVGDSAGDLPMLERVSLPFFVGANCPNPELIHIPACDIGEVVGIILKTWAE